jgi:alpha-ribazole phosphatase
MMDLTSLPAGCSLRLILLRHGKPGPEVEGRCYGQLDCDLSAAGREEMIRKSEKLKGARVHALYSSPSKRAQESALIVGRSLGLEPRIAPELREIHFGAFEGRTYNQIRELYPAEFELWMSRPAEMAFPGGESFTQFRERVLPFLETLLKTHPGETVVLCSHAGVNRVVLAHVLGIPGSHIFRIAQEYAALNVVDFLDGSPVVKLVND